jgi:hypothetical protein
MNCMCSDPDCIANGCKQYRQYTQPIWTYNPPPQGCICPAGAEKTCQGNDCPRRAR